MLIPKAAWAMGLHGAALAHSKYYSKPIMLTLQRAPQELHDLERAACG